VYSESAVNPPVNVGLSAAEEGRYVEGTWIPGRRVNGDETPQWKALRSRDEYGDSADDAL
jgi:hypothetical protein